MAVYTLGEWTARPGQEQAFVEAWQDFATWTSENVAGSTWAKLLQDRDRPERFISFGPWAHDEAVALWRQHPGFEEHVGRIQQTVDAFTPHTMDGACSVGPATPDP